MIHLVDSDDCGITPFDWYCCCLVFDCVIVVIVVGCWVVVVIVVIVWLLIGWVGMVWLVGCCYWFWPTEFVSCWLLPYGCYWLYVRIVIVVTGAPLLLYWICDQIAVLWVIVIVGGVIGFDCWFDRLLVIIVWNFDIVLLLLWFTVLNCCWPCDGWYCWLVDIHGIGVLFWWLIYYITIVLLLLVVDLVGYLWLVDWLVLGVIDELLALWYCWWNITWGRVLLMTGCLDCTVW